MNVVVVVVVVVDVLPTVVVQIVNFVELKTNSVQKLFLLLVLMVDINIMAT